MIDFRPIILVTGILLTTLGTAMLIPAVADAASGNPDWQVFSLAAALTLFAGVGMTLMTWGHASDLTLKEAFLLVTFIWIFLPAFSALPFAFSELSLSYTDAFFEAMSGLTTTGATVVVGLDTAPPGILLWRSLLQWLGGLGVVVMAIALLPILQIGGMQMFKVEAFDTAEKVLPSAAGLAGSLTSFYVAITAIFAFLLWLAGLSAFDAVNHSMTSIATGGFSTRDASVGHFNSAAIDYTITAAMIAGSLPFVLYLRAVRGDALPLFKDSQVHVFFYVVAVLAISLTGYQMMQEINGPVTDQFRYALFNSVSILTGTGYATHEFDRWGPFAIAVFFVIMFIGGCSGSTSCGMKIFRFQVVFAALVTELRRMVHPNGVFVPRYNGRPIGDSVIASVMSFMFLFMFCFSVIAVLLNLMGLDMLTSISAAATTMANVGPGLGEIIGPAGNFAPLPDAAKWLLSISMLIGRLEVFTVLVVLTPAFWRA
ncbi:TrkH family potassium uptake protein [Tepidicaulis sp. LMO-SS28]|uniref:TrkH family potassium uptake protein n=1 Tax=Tepidicaulis sp. LMO-SS28 TaxID=3447455 RepID=UPI003EE2DD75